MEHPQIAELISQFRDNSESVRNSAQSALEEIGVPAIPALAAAAAVGASRGIGWSWTAVVLVTLGAGVNILGALQSESAALTYVSPPSEDYHDQVTLQAQLLEGTGNAVDIGKTVSFQLGSQSCSGQTLAVGSVSCALTIADPPTSTTVAVSFAGDASYLAATPITPTFTITREEAAVAYSGSTKADYTDPVTFRATLTEDSAVPLSGRQITFTISSGVGFSWYPKSRRMGPTGV